MPFVVAKLIITDVTISVTPCPQHIAVPFCSRAPTSHVPRLEQSQLLLYSGLDDLTTEEILKRLQTSSK